MADVFEDTASRLWWGIRRYALIFALTIGGAVVILNAAGPAGFTRDYEASALVIATKQGIPVTAMPKFAETVFDGGSVAERAVSEGRLPIAPNDLIPDFAELEPVEDNIVFRVVGRNADRRLSADIANAVASALVEELNEAGPEVGVFAVQDTARVPEAVANAELGVPVLTVLGIVIGLLVGAGVVGFILTIRRPVLGAEEASALLGSPLIGTPTLPSKRGLPPDSAQVPGLAAVVKRLFPTPTGTVVLIAPAGFEELRTIFAQLIAGAVGRDAPMFLVQSRDSKVSWLYEHLETGPKVVVTQELPDRSTWARMTIVVDGPSARGSDAPQMIPETARIVLVVKQGSSRSRLLEVGSQFLPGEIAGVIFVKRGTTWPWLMSPRTAPAPAAAGHAGAAASPAPAPGPTPPDVPVQSSGPMYVDRTVRRSAEPAPEPSAEQRRRPMMPPRAQRQPPLDHSREDLRPRQIRLDETREPDAEPDNGREDRRERTAPASEAAPVSGGEPASE